MERPSGVIAPVPTPLDDGLDFDPAALERHLAWLVGEGLDGALVLGTNGEFPSFSLRERVAVAEAAAKCSEELRLILNIGSCALPDVLGLLEVAHRCRYSAVLLPPPFYFRKAPLGGLVAFFRAVLERAEVPVLLYHFPQVNGVAISEELLEELEGAPLLEGVKDTSGEQAEMDRLSRRFAEGTYLVGTDRLVAACRAAGGRGSITAVANVAPRLVAGAAVSTEGQQRLDAVRGALEEYGLGPAVKAVLRRRGFGRYATRPPLLELAAAQEEPLSARLGELGVEV